MQRLEKLNSSIDIIPLQSSTVGMDRRQQQPGGMMKPVDKSRVDDGNVGRVFRDPMIISRVRTYLYENEDKVYIDVTEMADCLQRKYRDYRGKKRGPFRSMVRQAYHEIRESIAKQTDTQQWPEDEDDEIDIELDAMQCNPHMPAEYLQAYKQQRALGGRQNGNSSDKELIDISSDDEGTAKNDSAPTATTSADKDSMEVEQVKKRPHLSPSIDSHRTVTQQLQNQEIFRDTFKDSRNRNEKSRKRPRDKEIESPFDVGIKKKAKDIPVVNPSVKFSDIGGSTKVLETVANLLLHLKHPEVYTKLGISPPRGFLLHGPPGCGKTLLAHAIAGELQLPLLKVAAPELVAGVSGESEQRIRELFEQAVAIAPCILFLDEIDAVAPHRATAQKEMERRIVSQLLSCLDELSLKENGSKVLVIGATNRPDSIDPALRRAGRFDREVSLGIPDKVAREAILRVHTAKVTLSPDVSLQQIAALTPGFVGADLVALIREAAMAAVNRTFEDLKSKVVDDQILDESPLVSSSTVKNKVDESVIECTTEKTDEVSEKKEEKEEEPVTKADNTVNDENKKEDKEDAVMTNEDEKKSEEVSVQSDSKTETEASVAESPASPTPAVEKPQTEEQPESSKADESETTDVSIASPKEPSPKEPSPKEVSSKETPPPDVTEDPLSVDNMQVEETNGRKDNIEPLKLDEMLAWLHNEPPLSNEQLALLCVEEKDFDTALQNVQPSAKREGFATVPDVTWNDIGSLQDIRQELQMTILAPIRHSEQFESLGLNTPTGVLLCGPPGCGKTLLAKAIANEAGINFISVKGPELLNMYVGESEKAVRQCFMRARNSAPCVIFFDELDALCPKRSEGDSTATSRVVNQMLTEMDGVEGRKGVFLMAASNRPDIIDPAVLRPGRLDKILYVGLPNAVDREDILRALTKNGYKPKLAADVNLSLIANSERCEGYTGADLAALIREAGVETLREIMSGIPIPAEICARHLDAAFDKIRPSVQEKDIKHYEKLKKLYSVKRSQNMDVAMTLESPSDSTVEAMET